MLTNGEIVHLIGVEIPKVQAKEGNILDGYSSDEPSEKSIEDARRLGVDVMTLAKMGQEATDFVKTFFNVTKEIHIEYDVEKKDKYGRTLAYVYVNPPILFVAQPPGWYFDKESGWVFLNATIIKSGYASPMTIPPNVKHADLFKELYEEAREQGRGLWRDKSGEACSDKSDCFCVGNPDVMDGCGKPGQVWKCIEGNCQLVFEQLHQ